MADLVVETGTTQAHALLGNDKFSHVFKFNPDEVNWEYKENTVSTDTIGGRVVQLLSIQISNISVSGRAGSRAELQRMANNMRDIMNYHVQSQRPVTFRVPSRRWNFTVYVAAMPQIGWDVATTGYPYQLDLAVEEDVSGIPTLNLETTVLDRLRQGIGYNPAVHGGDPSGFEQLVQSVLAVSGNDANNTPSELSGGGYVQGDGNTGTISGQETPQLQTILRALRENGMLRTGRTCGADINSYGNSEHTCCNAKDNMIASKADGDNIAAFLEHHLRRSTLPIHCIIWYRRIISRERLSEGWREYNGDSPHTDHIHVSGWPSCAGAC